LIAAARRLSDDFVSDGQNHLSGESSGLKDGDSSDRARVLAFCYYAFGAGVSFAR